MIAARAMDACGPRTPTCGFGELGQSQAQSPAPLARSGEEADHGEESGVEPVDVVAGRIDSQ